MLTPGHGFPFGTSSMEMKNGTTIKLVESLNPYDEKQSAAATGSWVQTPLARWGVELSMTNEISPQKWSSNCSQAKKKKLLKQPHATQK